MSVVGTQRLPSQSVPGPYRWTRASYHRAAEAGLFDGLRVQLIEGEVIEMAAQGQPHVIAVSRVADAVRAAFGSGHWVRVQAPIRMGDLSEPGPDVSVVTGSDEDYPTEPPDKAVLVVEVSDTSLDLDRRRKVKVYATAGIPEYWIVNLEERRLEVYRFPGGVRGPRYATPVVLSSDESVSPLGAPSAVISVVRLLPPVASRRA